MKRDARVVLSIVLVCFLVILMISVPLASAGWLSDLWGKITGKAVDSNTCTDSDGSDNFYVKGYRINYAQEYADYGVQQFDYCINNPDIQSGYVVANNGKMVSECSGDNCYIIEYHCKSDLSDAHIGFKCPNGCSDGACRVAPTNATLICTDSDGGKNYDVKGTLVGWAGGKQYTRSDECTGNKPGYSMAEYYCLPGFQGAFTSVGFDCPYGCINGACVKTPMNVTPTPNVTITCADSDGGLNLSAQGDVSINGAVVCSDSCATPQELANSNNMDQIFECWCTGSGQSSGWYSCPTGTSCLDGACKSGQIEPLQKPEGNIKNLSKYSDRGVFLVSDEDWEDVLPLVSVTTWTQQIGDNEQCVRGYGTADNTCVYPTLIYHNEASSFDADSIIYFMQQYQDEKVTIIGQTPQELDNLIVAQPELGAGISQDKIERISPLDYLSYWQSYQDVVYVEDNYELGLMASTYASLLNAPLIIKETILDTSITFTEKNVICVGNVAPSGASCNEQYTLKQLQQKYVDMTKTDKIVLINPNDLSITVNEAFQPEKSSSPINEIYSKTSLSAPILASAKHEIIFSIAESDYEKVDEFIQSKINSLGINVNYLTIIAAPSAIQMSFGTDPSLQLKEVDNSIYGHLNSHTFQDFAVGRIFGLTISDISSYVSRDLFYNKIVASNKFAMLVPRGQFNPQESDGWKIQSKSNDYLLESIGLQKNSVYLDEINSDYFNSKTDLSDKLIISYVDHGYTEGWAYGINTPSVRDNNVLLVPSFIVSDACLTCAYDVIGTSRPYGGGSKPNLFCTNLLRRGALGFVGAIDTSGGTTALSKDLIEYIANGNSFGNALKILKNNEVLENCNLDPSGPATIPFGSYVHPFCEPFYILLGDPTVNLNLVYPNIDKVTVDSALTNQELVFTIKIPQSKEIIPNIIGEPYYKSPQGPNCVRYNMKIDPNDLTGNTLRWDGEFSFSFVSATQQLITQIKAEFIDADGKIITMLPRIDNYGTHFFNYKDGINNLQLKYAYDEKENKYRFYATTLGSNKISIDRLSPSHEYKIYLHLGGSP